MTLKYISLFAGCGGIDAAMDAAGCECVLQAERDPQALSVLAKHWPNVKRVDDVRLVRPGECERPDWIVGGPPCQDYSVAGLRAGLAGDKGAMWWEYLRVVREFSPDGFLVENVPGMLSSCGGRDFGTILASVAELGYGWAYRICDAQWWGLPQRRRRVFLVGCAGGDVRRAAEILFESDSVPWNPPPSREAGQRTAATLTACVASGRGVNRPGRRREDDVNIVQTLQSHHPRNSPDGDSLVAIERIPIGPLCSHSKEHGHAMGTQQAAESGQLIAFAQNCRDEVRDLGEVAGALAGQPGMKQQTFVAVPVAFPFTPDVSLALNGKATGRYDPSVETFIATNYADGTYTQSDRAAPLTTTSDPSRNAPTVANGSSVEPFAAGVVHSLRGEGFDASEDGTGRGTPILPVAFTANQHDELRDLGDCAATLKAEAGAGRPALCAVPHQLPPLPDVSVSTMSGSGGQRQDKQPRTVTPYGVRRLMPIETERCQGMDDDFTRWGINAKGETVELSDSARYRLVGNSVAVPVLIWIGQRIAAVHAAAAPPRAT